MVGLEVQEDSGLIRELGPVGASLGEDLRADGGLPVSVGVVHLEDSKLNVNPFPLVLTMISRFVTGQDTATHWHRRSEGLTSTW